MTNLNLFSKEIHASNKLRGFDAKRENIGQSLMLIVSELSEALEADRKSRHSNLMDFFNEVNNDSMKPSDHFIHCFEKHIKDTFEDEIADSIIRLLDFCGAFEIDIERHIGLKLLYNSTRPYKHGKKY